MNRSMRLMLSLFIVTLFPDCFKLMTADNAICISSFKVVQPLYKIRQKNTSKKKEIYIKKRKNPIKTNIVPEIIDQILSGRLFNLWRVLPKKFPKLKNNNWKEAIKKGKSR